ncbi:chemotaxis protein CheW [Buttiauxella sp. A2-C2_NF]|uniref:chemotaxis protein CheW n=1 Tax=Buttiauxella TaxID=82976 RepID=UPI001E551051|nr:MULTISPECIES: chemotaxis protein CheW [Buttiauxella]MCE0827383.1 chemotaxis protein CheW [Buttiauxella ferragutiae]
MSEPLEQILSQYQTEKREITNVDEPQCSLVLFKVADKNFAFYGAQIKEILADRPISWVPGCPPSLEGVINHRGRVESVITLNSLIETPAAENVAKRTILMGRGQKMQSGILVDKLVDVLDVAQSQIHPAAEHLSAAMQKVVVGIVPVGKEYFALLDLDLIFERYLETCGYDALA